jgi:ATP-dependent Clp protease ATP-binding subunit ClpA
MGSILRPNLGFGAGEAQRQFADGIMDKKSSDKVSRAGLEAARRKFSPEFMNRIDKTVVFRTLTQSDLRQVLDIELNDVQNRIMSSQTDKQFIFRCTNEAKEFLLREGTDIKYGARHLKRAIERHLVFPLSNLIATGQIGLGDVIKIDLGGSADRLTFSKERVITSFAANDSTNIVDFPNRRANQAGAKLHVLEGEMVNCERMKSL